MGTKPTYRHFVAERSVLASRDEVAGVIAHTPIDLGVGVTTRPVSVERPWRMVHEVNGVPSVRLMQLFVHVVPGPTTRDPAADDAALILMVSLLTELVEPDEPAGHVEQVEQRTRIYADRIADRFRSGSVAEDRA